LKEDWRRIGGGLEEDWRRIGGGLEDDRSRIGGVLQDGESMEGKWRFNGGKGHEDLQIPWHLR
jgi:hypothetical protein